MKASVVRVLGYGILLCCSALAHAQLPSPLFETPLRKDPVIIPANNGGGALSGFGEQVQLTLRADWGLTDRGRSYRINASNGEVLDSRRGGRRNSDGFSFIASRTDPEVCSGPCFALGSQLEGYDPEDRPLWRVFRWSVWTPLLRTGAYSPAIVADDDARSPYTGSRLLADPDCMVRVALSVGNLLSCKRSPAQLKLQDSRGGGRWTLDAVLPATVAVAADGARTAVVTSDDRVHVVDTATGATQMLSPQIAALNLPPGRVQLLWATNSRLYLQARSEVLAFSGAGSAMVQSWQRSFAELDAGRGLEGSDAQGRLYLRSATNFSVLIQISLDGASFRPALNGYSRYESAFTHGPHRFGRTLVEATAQGVWHGIDADTGEERWSKPSFTAELPQVVSATVSGDAVYVASAGYGVAGETQLRLDAFDREGTSTFRDAPFESLTLVQESLTSFAPLASGQNIIISALRLRTSFLPTDIVLRAYSQSGRFLWQREIARSCRSEVPGLSYRAQANADFVVIGIAELQTSFRDPGCVATVLDARTGATLRQGSSILLLPGTATALEQRYENQASKIVDIRSGNDVATLPPGRPTAIDLIGERIVLQSETRSVISLRFDGSVATSFALPLHASGQLFALDGLLLARTFSDTGESGTSAFDLNTGALRWASRGATALDKWIKTGDRWVITRAGATRQR